jgi:5'-AMP-activated protein kinase catalytic alpha subunit
MVSGNKYNGFNIDIWATGIILFAMVCGYLPFEHSDKDKLFEQILKAKLDFPSNLSDSVKDLISKILITDPNKRINIEQIKKHSFYLLGKETYYQKMNKNKIKKHNSDNYLRNINLENIKKKKMLMR